MWPLTPQSMLPQLKRSQSRRWSRRMRAKLPTIPKIVPKLFNRNLRHKLSLRFMLPFRIWRKLCNLQEKKRRLQSLRKSLRSRSISSSTVRKSVDLWNLWSRVSKAVSSMINQPLCCWATTNCTAYSTSLFLIARLQVSTRRMRRRSSKRKLLLTPLSLFLQIRPRR